MAVRTIGRIILYEQLTQDKIDALLASADTIAFEIERRYILGEMPEVLTAILPTQFDGFAVDYVESLKEVVDVSSFIHEEDAIMFIVKYNSTTKEFDLTSSYVRNNVDSTATMGTVITGQLLKAIFITPGIENPVYTVIDLPFGQSLDTVQLNVLKDNGVIIDPASTGDFFTITTQSVPYKVGFYQPTSVTTEKYSIEFDLQNKTIEL